MESPTNKSIQLEQWGGSTKLKNTPMPIVEKDKVLIKIMTTTIHPADLMFLKGKYGKKKPKIFPITAGFEASGIIVQIGEEVPDSYINKKVCLFADSNREGHFHGLWSQYASASVNSVFILDDQDASYDKLCFFVINPFAAVGFIDTIKKNNAKGVIQSGANSTLGQMLIKLCAREGIKTVNLIRKEKHIDELKRIGATHVINTSEADWKEQLNNKAREIEATLCFDCIGGEFTYYLIKAVLDNTIIYHYGNLLGESIKCVDSDDLIFHNKQLKGWWLAQWLQSMKKEEFSNWLEYIKKIYFEKDSILATKTSKQFKLEEFNDALDYYKNHMNEGKVIIHPNDES